MSYYSPITELEDIQLDLKKIIKRLNQVSKDAPQIRGKLESYIIPHLECWVGDERQCGGIPDLLEDLIEEDEDNYYE